MRKLGREHKENTFFLELAQSRNDEVVANMVIVLIHQTNNLLERYLAKQIEKFIKEGGFRENLAKQRIAYRSKK
jgi:four helix bundle suffix protein